MKQVKYKTKAIRQIKKIKDMVIKKEITEKINQLKNYPDTSLKVSRYKTTDLLKFRVKKWRVFFTAELEIIKIQEVKKRNERTYK
ncbi:MAG: type II toxin-antitoxin system RelE/ParE family toxin [Deltaproteobacteria bacterium]|nr:type II toxin-antitoxin system RelE/ParE family toxin [Deltaproteobacteria bacterium]